MFYSIFGDIENPFKTVNPLGKFYGGATAAQGGGLILFLNNVLRLIITAASLWALFQFVFAAFQFINAGGNPKNVETAWSKIWQVLIGLIMIVGSLTLAAILGFLLFGNPMAILQPSVYGP